MVQITLLTFEKNPNDYHYFCIKQTQMQDFIIVIEFQYSSIFVSNFSHLLFDKYVCQPLKKVNIQISVNK